LPFSRACTGYQEVMYGHPKKRPVDFSDMAGHRHCHMHRIAPTLSGAGTGPGPWFFYFPLWRGDGGTAIVRLVQAMRSPSGDPAKPFCSDPQKFRKMVYGFIALAVYSIAMDYLGFALSTVLFLGFFLRVIEPQKWRVVFIFSILPTLCAYIVFKSYLDVQLPEGFLGF
jgi:hypothetical protein